MLRCPRKIFVGGSDYSWLKTQHVGGNTLKIYKVSAGNTHTLWTNFQSAAQSHAYWGRKHAGATLDYAHVPDDAWKPVDKRTEARLSQVQYLWEQLVASDPDGLDNLLDELVKRVQPAKQPETPILLTDRERAEAMRALDQLVA